MSKIAIFGGSFNPPHHGHRRVVSELLSRSMVDEVWLLPVGNHAFAKQLAPTKNRLAMLEIFIDDISNTHLGHSHVNPTQIKICNYELKQPLSLTYTTLKHLQLNHPADEFVFVMGGDQLKDFHKWHNYQQLAHEFEILVYPRIFTSGENSPAATQLTQQQALSHQYNLHFLANFPVVEISSTEIRQHPASSLDLDPPIRDYIIQHHLYQ